MLWFKGPLRNIHWIFSFLHRTLFSCITDTNFTGLDYDEDGGCLIRNRNCFPFSSYWVYPWFYGGVLWLIIFFLGGGMVSFYVVFFALFVFVLCPVPNVARVSVSSVNSWLPLLFFLTFINMLKFLIIFILKISMSLNCK